MTSFTNERDGQIEFYKTFLPRIAPHLTLDDILADNNDGVLNGNLLEFKLNISDLNAHLFQCIKYLSALRIKGKPLPANIIIIGLNSECAYLYHSSDFITEIEKVYIGAASKNNYGFIGSSPILKYEYGSSQLDADNLIKTLKETNYTKINIDENCIVGWANTYYKTRPNARKEDFLGDDTGMHKTIGEIRNPDIFKEFIHPYKGKSNVRFEYLMDALNDDLNKRNLGAFYTPIEYAKKSHELLRIAIDRVPEGNDYVIIDRCCGTGNLEKNLSDEELSHCILSTVEYYEYKVLQELLGSKVRHIIPPVEADDTFTAGMVKGADALSREYVENPVINQYISNPKCTIILFENPPYAETTSIEHQKKKAGKESSLWKKSYLMGEMKKDIFIKGTAYNDLGNLFIWSGFKYYLRQPTDSYIVYSPVKYWKAQNLINKQFIKGFAFNRRHFHTNTEACVMCALWSAEDANIKEFYIDAFNISSNSSLLYEGTLPVKRIFTSYSQKLYDKRVFPDDKDDGIFCEFDGTESPLNRTSIRIKPITNDNIIAYLAVKGANFDNPDSSVHLLRVGAYDANGFYIRKDSFLDKLPMFCASRYITYNRAWTERARVMKSADMSDTFLADVNSGKLMSFLTKCLIFTCLEMQNHCRSFLGSDNKFYRNELCLDDSNGDTVSTDTIKHSSLDDQDYKMLKMWNEVLSKAKSCAEYDSKLTYGLYQIFADLDTFTENEETGEKVWNNIELHSALQTLKTHVKEYYNREIVPTLFDYEFLK